MDAWVASHHGLLLLLCMRNALLSLGAWVTPYHSDVGSHPLSDHQRCVLLLIVPKRLQVAL